MMKQLITISLLLLAVAATASDELRQYYEQQKKEIAQTFQAPELGSEVSIRLANGQPRTGILMKLEANSLSLLTDSGSVNYKRTALHKTSRAQFFAEDYAETLAVEKTREYKLKLQQEIIAQKEADTHAATLSVTSGTEKSSDKDVEKSAKENKDGSTTTTTVKTRTESEIQNLKVTIANTTSHPDTYTLEWYFFSKALPKSSKKNKPAPKTKIVVHDSGSRRVIIGARKRVQEQIASKAFEIKKTATTRFKSTSNRTPDPSISESGVENEGWLVRLKYGDELLDQKASAQKFIETAWISQLGRQ